PPPTRSAAKATLPVELRLGEARNAKYPFAVVAMVSIVVPLPRNAPDPPAVRLATNATWGVAALLMSVGPEKLLNTGLVAAIEVIVPPIGVHRKTPAPPPAPGVRPAMNDVMPE